jgi:hypothetical protein
MHLSTRYEIGDTFWIIYNNEVREITITNFLITVSESIISTTTYTFRFVSNNYYYNVYPESEIEKMLFPTRLHLIESLLK